jgi:hypothetical protein
MITNMDWLENISKSGLTITLSPTQLLVATALLGVVLASNAKSLLFAWHVKSALPTQTSNTVLTTIGTSLSTGCTAFLSTTVSVYSNVRSAWGRGALRSSGHLDAHTYS